MHTENLKDIPELEAFLTEETEDGQKELYPKLKKHYKIILGPHFNSHDWHSIEIVAYLGKLSHSKTLLRSSPECLKYTNPLIQAIRSQNLEVVKRASIL